MSSTRTARFARTARMATYVLGAIVGLLVATPLHAYIILLKDGTRIVAKDKPRVQGDRLIFMTNIGTVQSVPASDLDQKKTDEANKASTGDAYVLDTPEGKGAVEVDAKKPTLSEFIKTKKVTRLTMKEQPETVPGMPAGEETKAPKGPSEKLAMDKVGGDSQPIDPVVNDTFLRALESSGIRGPHLFPIPHGVRVQALTDSEQQVFAALGAVARGLKESRAAGRSLDKAEVWLATTSGQSAGHFEMSAEEADSLLNGKIGAAKYFVANVIF